MRRNTEHGVIHIILIIAVTFIAIGILVISVNSNDTSQSRVLGEEMIKGE